MPCPTLIEPSAQGLRQIRFIRSSADLALHGEPAQAHPDSDEPPFESACITRFDGLGAQSQTARLLFPLPYCALQGFETPCSSI